MNAYIAHTLMLMLSYICVMRIYDKSDKLNI